MKLQPSAINAPGREAYEPALVPLELPTSHPLREDLIVLSVHLIPRSRHCFLAQTLTAPERGRVAVLDLESL